MWFVILVAKSAQCAQVCIRVHQDIGIRVTQSLAPLQPSFQAFDGCYGAMCLLLRHLNQKGVTPYLLLKGMEGKR